MDLHHLEYFLQLARYEHVSQTADLLNITQSSLSKSLSLLEDELGLKLFDRKGKRIQLNENGKQFAHYTSQALQLLNTGVMAMKQSLYETVGTLTIVSHCYAGIITPCANEYTNLNPLANFVICEPALAKDTLNSDHIDFLLSASSDDQFDENKEQFWIPYPLFQEEYVLIMSPRFMDIPPETEYIDLADFKDSPFVTMLQSNVLFSDVTYQLCQNAGFFPKTHCRTDSFQVKISMVDSGHAVALLPESCLREAEMLSPGLRHFHMKNHSSKRTVYLMRKKKNIMTEVALDFWDFALDYFGTKEDQKE